MTRNDHELSLIVIEKRTGYDIKSNPSTISLVKQAHSLLVVDEILEGLLVAVADGDIDVAKDDAVALNLADFAFLDNEGAVHPDETRCGQHLLDGLHVHQREYGMGRLFGVDFHIILQTLDVADVVKVNLQQLVLALDKDAGGFLLGLGGSGLLFLLLGELEPLHSPVASLKEIGIADGLQQVVQSVDTKAVNRILVKYRSWNCVGNTTTPPMPCTASASSPLTCFSSISRCPNSMAWS